MNSLENESEAIQLSIYCDIICQVLYLHRNISINKIVPIAYILKKHNMYEKAYTAKDTNDLAYKLLSLLNGKFNDYCDDIEIIFKSIHLLILNKNILMEDGILFFTEKKDNAKNLLYDDSTFIYHAVEDCRKMPEIQFLKEMLQNV